MFELLPDGSEGESLVDFWGVIIPDRENSRLKVPEAMGCLI